MITEQTLREVFNLNRMSGKIETGKRYWVCDYLTIPYNKQYLEPSLLFIREQSNTMSVSPIEKSYNELNIKIDNIINQLIINYERSPKGN